MSVGFYLAEDGVLEPQSPLEWFNQPMRVLEPKEGWGRVEGFSAKEAWGDAGKMQSGLVMLLAEWRRYLRAVENPSARIHVYQGWSPGTGHATDSHHYRDPCPAADVGIEGVDLLTAYLAAERFPFGGIGLYPHWKPHPGLHLDLYGKGQGDTTETLTPGARWYRNRAGRYGSITPQLIAAMVRGEVP